MEIQTEKASDCPRVSILIPCYDRPDDLTNTLQHCLRQTGCSHEIVIIDDGTPNDAVAAVAAAFPQCRYVRLDANVGLIKARNIGMTRCKGEYVVNLDDDSWLVDPRALDRIVAFMDRSPDVAVLALNVDQPASGLLWNPSAQPVPVGNYTGCGNVQRKALIAEVGGFIAEFIRQGEELEQSMRIIAANYKVVAMPSIQVIHNESTVNRDVRKICSMEAVNILRREAILAPAPLIPFGF
ncbi:MAG: glycosyltransferase, partial [Sphingomonadales bacterium]|nr:glycosyltransferase [Sphingomonadales bacterium]